MKKQMFAAALSIGLSCTILAGCGSKDAGDAKTEAKMKTLGDYKGLKVAESAATVSDETIQTHLDSLASAHSTTEKLESGEVKDGDKVNIDFVGKVDGKEFDGGTASGQDLEIGSDSYIDGFEDGLIGKKVGDTVELNLTFPDDYSTANLAGKDVVFSVTINYINRTKEPTVDDAFIKKYYSYGGDTLEAYKTYYKEQQKETQIMNAVWTDYLKTCEVESYNSEDLTERTKYYKDYYENYYYMYFGADLATYLEAMEMTQEEWNTQMEDYAKDYLKAEMVTMDIADKEGITPLSDKDYEEQASSLAEEETYENASEMESDYGSKDTTTYALVRKQVEKVIADNAEIIPDEETTTDASESTEAGATTAAAEDTTAASEETTTAEDASAAETTPAATTEESAEAATTTKAAAETTTAK